MASALLELRKAAGFKKSAEFAKVVKIPPSTYARYESSPDKIPMGAARKLADWFRVPIDVIVGREEVDVRSLRGDVQKSYDRLSPRSKSALEEFLSFLAERDMDEGLRMQEEQERRYEAAAWRYERIFLEELQRSDGLDDLLALGTADEIRSAFKEFVAGRAAARLEGEAAEEAVDNVMAAYDRLHGIWERGGGSSFGVLERFLGPYADLEFDGREGR